MPYLFPSYCVKGSTIKNIKFSFRLFDELTGDDCNDCISESIVNNDDWGESDADDGDGNVDADDKEGFRLREYEPFRQTLGFNVDISVVKSCCNTRKFCML